MTYRAAIAEAQRLARRQCEPAFVVRKAGDFHAASAEDLDTFFCGLSPEAVTACVLSDGTVEQP